MPMITADDGIQIFYKDWGPVDGHAVLLSHGWPLRTDDNPEGLPVEVFDAIRAGERASRSQLYRDLADGPFFGHNRRGDVPQGMRDAFWLQGLASGHRGAYECIAEITVPSLVIHGDDDQIVPIEVGGLRSAKLIADAELKVYEGAGHALPDTEKQRLSQDLLDFIES
ncbi:alpha/beta fold hydrolase [Nocardia rhizosphaerihabitans]|uniref:AB hydrolase-1 domain-containing protein n=1 Tax=Nocardia rhizosphaerihabitans TaxID=1691570 RepID=A0ABQ2KH95_9NOCA|nr:alpha/beta hydrolase [Nocardia rhizosphaerihabitans]GGN81218.1 hypothetical protein GCM10011610_31400 [Nocardia rhizosphaerihabitans]